MESVLPTLVWVVVVAAALVALITLVGTGRSYRQIGGGGIVHDSDRRAEDRAAPDAAPEREAEIRQMLEARNARRARRGEAQLDVEAELAALERPPPDASGELREDVRRHVLAQNERRVRAGRAPLDVETEIERRIRELT